VRIRLLMLKNGLRICPRINDLALTHGRQHGYIRKSEEQVLSKGRGRVVMERGYTLGQVEQAVCRLVRIEREELGRAQRRPAIKRARELLMYLGRHHTGASLREMADRLGVRDISTVSHGEKRVAKGLRESSVGAKELKRALDKVYSLIQA
jgi:chromosomal replication initiation ATPase DnaA